MQLIFVFIVRHSLSISTYMFNCFWHIWSIIFQKKSAKITPYPLIQTESQNGTQKNKKI